MSCQQQTTRTREHPHPPTFNKQFNPSFKMYMVLATLLLCTPALGDRVAYHKWLTDNENVQLSNKLDLSTNTPTVLDDVKEGEILFSINTNTVLFPTGTDDYPAFSKVLKDTETTKLMSPTIRLALLLMYEKQERGKESFWWPMLNNLPTGSASTVFWPEEELKMLNGTAIFSKTIERISAVANLHRALEPMMISTTDQTPLFETFTAADLLVAVNHIFARTISAATSVFSAQHGFGSSDGAIPIMIPFIESLPRSISPTVHVDIRAMSDADADTAADASHSIVLIANRDLKKNELLLLNADLGKTNTELLLHTGQFILHNEHHGVPLYIRLSATDPQFEIKTKILKQLNLTNGSEFLVNTTGIPPMPLLKMLRIQLLEFHNLDSYTKILRQDEPISLSNELMVVRALWYATESLSNKFTNRTIEYEIELLESFNNANGSDEPRSMTRIEVAAHLRLSEKRILASLSIWVRNHWLGMIDRKQLELYDLQEFRLR